MDDLDLMLEILFCTVFDVRNTVLHLSHVTSAFTPLSSQSEDLDRSSISSYSALYSTLHMRFPRRVLVVGWIGLDSRHLCVGGQCLG
jgi:hypothetical protein